MARRNLNLLSFNVRSLIESSRRFELVNFLRYHNIDICFLQETHLKFDTNICLENYNIVRDNSPQGTAIVFNKKIKYSVINITNIKFPNCFVEISLSFSGSMKKILFGSIYVPCNFPNSDFIESLDAINCFSNNYYGVFVGGDFNSRSLSWGDSFDNLNGNSFKNWLQYSFHDFTRLCDITPSFPNGSSFLDHFLISSKFVDQTSDNIMISTISSFSDHFALKLSVKIPEYDLIYSPPILFTSFEKTNWRDFQSDIDLSLSEISILKNRNLSNVELDNFIDSFTECVNNITDLHSEKINLKNKKFKISDSIKHLFKIKYSWQKELKQIYHRNFNRVSPEYKLLSKQIQLLKTIIKEQVELFQANELSNRISNIKPGPNAYKNIYNIIGKKRSKGFKKVIVDNITYTEDSDKVELFREHFSNVYRNDLPNRPNISEVFLTVDNCLSNSHSSICEFSSQFNSLTNSDTSHFTCPSVVKTIIQSLNAKKSSGSDKISNFIIKKLPFSAIEFLTIIFNNCLNNSYFPNSWKISKICPLVKKENNFSLNNSRPISLLSNFGKLFERIIREKMDISVSHEYIPCYQFGFKRNHSAVDALVKFHNDVILNLREQKCTVAISLDIEKAFDKAFHKGIIYKLIQIGFNPFIIKILSSYFENRKFFVNINNTHSNVSLINSGVPQGAILAPLLYNILIYDIPHIFNGSNSILYADDSLIYASHKSPFSALELVKNHLSVIDDYYKSWGIKINPLKTEAICFRNASGKCPYYVVPQSKKLVLSLNGVNVQFKDKIKYLGITFNKLFKFNDHARIVKNKAIRIKGMFTKLLLNKHLNEKTKLLIYKVSIRSSILYGFPVWFTISPTVAYELEVLERSVLRFCINRNFETYIKRFSNRYIYENARIQPLLTYALSLLNSYTRRSLFHKNNLIVDIFNQNSSFNWSTSYLSPIGIHNENICLNIDYSDPNPSILPEFYKKSTPFTHRG